MLMIALCVHEHTCAHAKERTNASVCVCTYATGAPVDDEADVVGEKGGDDGGNDTAPGDVLVLT